MAEIVNRPGPTPRIWGRITAYIRPWSSSTWDAAVASGAVAHMGSDARQAYAALFGLVPTIGTLNQQEVLLTSDLHSLGAATVLNDTSRDRLASDIARLNGLNIMMALGARAIVDRVRGMGVELAPADRARLTQELSKPCLMPDQPQPIV